jgi:hypothetical protein
MDTEDLGLLGIGLILIAFVLIDGGSPWRGPVFFSGLGLIVLGAVIATIDRNRPA